ncbi:MAG: GtrA family protein [Vicinamibacterales bacterium]
MNIVMITFRRWLRFNGVGLMGAALQLGLLAVLTRQAGLSVTLATLVAVEAAILHNFAWHQRVTWPDRTDQGGTIRRLLLFHGVNGGVSLAGNMVLTSSLTARGVDVVIANLIAILVCSLLNFMLGDRLVFRKRVVVPLCLWGLMFCAPGGMEGASGRELPEVALTSGPTAAAVAAWNSYVARVDARYADPGSPHFFALDARGVEKWRDRAAHGVVAMVEVPSPDAPDARIHHWAGGIYIPNTTLDVVIRRMQAYAGREEEFYQEVKASQLLERDGERLRVFMRLQRDAGVVTAEYNTEHAVEYRRRGADRASSRSVATKIAEVEHAGTPGERERPPGEDRGFLWRLNAYWRFEQAGSGVFIECESVSLSRSVPWLVRPIASPIVTRIARESLDRTLRSLRGFLTRAA